MVTIVRAKIREEDGHQVIVLPDDIRFDVPEVVVRRDSETGDLTVSGATQPRTARELFAAIDAHGPIPDEEWDAFVDRLNQPRYSRPDRELFEEPASE